MASTPPSSLKRRLESGPQGARPRSAVPVQLDIDVRQRLPEPVEVAAYYVAAEALANTAKHARRRQLHTSIFKRITIAFSYQSATTAEAPRPTAARGWSG